MSLKVNGKIIYGSPGRLTGSFHLENGNNFLPEHRASFGSLSQIHGGYPNGAYAPSWFIPPQQAGAISLRDYDGIRITGSPVLIPAMQMIVADNITISGNNLTLDQVINMIASGLITFSESAIVLGAGVNISVSDTISITISNNTLGGLIPMEASGTIQITGTQLMTALARIEAIIGGPTPLSPEGLANAVWSSLASDNNDPLTMGALLNGAGGGSTPSVIAAEVWDTLLAGHALTGSAGERLQKLLTLSQYLGLK